MLTLGDVAEATGGRLRGEGSTIACGVTTDSRAVEPLALFVALSGQRVDGHDYCRAALEAGASALLVSEAAAVPEGHAAVVVDDTLVALQRLAAWHRRRTPVLVAALTGSAGKTTTKELAAAVLSRRFRTLSTTGNLNNHVGLPLTLLRLGVEHERAVVEMGCSGFGEIALLAGLAAPEVGLVTNVGAAHLEGLGDLDGVARAKGELLAALGPGATAVVNADDPRVAGMRTGADRRLSFGIAPGATVRLLSTRHEPDGTQRLVLDLAGTRVEVEVRLLGEHNARNAAAAAALALAAGARPEDVVAGLRAVEAPAGRLRLVEGRGGLRVLDDSYNANPDSMDAALATLAALAGGGGRAHALLGEMLELGETSAARHEAVGRRVAALGVADLVVVGPGAEPIGAGAETSSATEVRRASTPEDGAALVLSRARPGDVVLVKGSRGARMERALAVLGGEEG